MRAAKLIFFQFFSQKTLTITLRSRSRSRSRDHDHFLKITITLRSRSWGGADSPTGLRPPREKKARTRQRTVTRARATRRLQRGPRQSGFCIIRVKAEAMVTPTRNPHHSPPRRSPPNRPLQPWPNASVRSRPHTKRASKRQWRSEMFPCGWRTSPHGLRTRSNRLKFSQSKKSIF